MRDEESTRTRLILRTPGAVGSANEIMLAYVERQLLQAVGVIAGALPAIRQGVLALLLLDHRFLWRRRIATVLAPLFGLGHFPIAAHAPRESHSAARNTQK